jgi:predicted AAA+ superfamily ATPase
VRNRSLARAIEELCFADHRIAMVSGPRQCGKTTLAKMMLDRREVGVYRNWDQMAFRREWAQNPSSVVPPPLGKDAPLVVLDEIHKERRWKRNLKGVFDTLKSPCDFLVTGSARLNVYRRRSDSLLGRHLHFRLHPFSLREMERSDVLPPDGMLEALFSRGERCPRPTQADLLALITFGPFPQPLLDKDVRKARLWRHTREQLVIRDDLRDFSRLPELDRIEMMTALLPDRVGSLFSLSAMGRDLEASAPTIRRWVNYLKDLYYVFEVRPYSKNVRRSLRREAKLYLWDYGALADQARRLENLVAHHLLKSCHYWTDTGEGRFELHFLRDKEKREIDFLIVRDGLPWLPVEVKLSDTAPSANWNRFLPMLSCKRGLQIVFQPFWKAHDVAGAQVLVAGAGEALRYFA